MRVCGRQEHAPVDDHSVEAEVFDGLRPVAYYDRVRADRGMRESDTNLAARRRKSS
jgi:hypothetical protein